MSPKFGSRYGKNSRIHCNPGNPIKDKYSTKYDEAGVLQFEVVGQVNTDDEIQSYADSVDLKLLLQRFANGEVDVLQRVQGFFADVTEMPKNYSELLNRVNDAENFFNSLPVEFKQKFNNSSSEFLASVDAQDFMDFFTKPEEGVKKLNEIVEEAVPDES